MSLQGRRIGGVIPTRNEAGALPAVLDAMPGFVDAVAIGDDDAADDLSAMEDLVGPVIDGVVDLALGSRVLGRRERGALTPRQIFGNWLACTLIQAVWGRRFTDLGPLRAISRDPFDRLGMADPDFGWTVEMQVKAARAGLRTIEIPTNYRRRIGVSKVSGTIAGTVRAGTKILWVIARGGRAVQMD